MLKWVVAAVVLVVVAVGLWAFEPWRAFTSSHLDEALPGVESAAAAEPGQGGGSEPADSGSTADSESDEPDQPDQPRLTVLSTGDFVDAEHGTDGTVRVLELEDGRRFVRLEGFSTSDGPDVHVGLSDAPSGGEWGSYDDGRYEGLGELKATDGNQNYEIPADVDLDGLTTVVIWCDRFNVAFGTAALEAA